MQKLIFASRLLLAMLLYIGSAVSQTKATVETIAVDLSCPRCNVIFLDIDLLRADFIRSKNEAYTPNINKFFKSSIRFNDVSAVSGVTAISNMSTLTGRDGFFTYSLLKNTYVDTPPQMPRKYGRLYAGLPTIAETLRNNGYRTVNVNHGYYAGKQMLLDRGFETYWGTGEVDSLTNFPGHAIRKSTEYISDFAGSKAPFFLLLRSEDLRGLPYRFPFNRKRLEDTRIDYRAIGTDYYEIVYQLRSDGKPTVDFPSYPRAAWMNKAQLAEYEKLSKKLYGQQLSYLDEELGHLFEGLKASGTMDRTIIVLYSNHGDGLYDNGIPNHGVSFQSCVSVPILIRHPKVKFAMNIDAPVALIDLVPTVYQMLNVESKSTHDGISLVDHMVKEKPLPERIFFGVDRESQYVRKGGMKLIAWADRSLELYDIKNDPTEMINLKDRFPILVSELEELLAEHELSSLDQALQLLLRDKRMGSSRVQ